MEEQDADRQAGRAGWFGLGPQALAGRASSQARPQVPTLAGSIALGTVGFTLVSVAGFVPWAVFGRALGRAAGEAGMYAACAVVFLVLSGLFLHRLILGPGSLGRFYAVFGVSFTLYSAAWIAGWMALRGHPGSVAGLLAGTAAMAGCLCAAFGVLRRWLAVTAILFVLNSAGYFLGGVVEAALFKTHRVAAMLSWGVFYGLGLGAGLGWAFHLCQTEARGLLAGTDRGGAEGSRQL